MTRPTSNPEPGERTGDGAGLTPVARSRLAEVGVGLQYLAAVCGATTGCDVQIDVANLPVRGLDASPIQVAQARLRFPDPDDAAFLAAVLGLPQVPRTSAADDWCWRGWLVGERPHARLLSVTLTSASDGVAMQSQRRGPA